MTTALLIVCGIALASGTTAYFLMKRNRKLKMDLTKAQSKMRVMQDRWDIRVINEQKLRVKMADDREFRDRMKKVKTDEEAIAVTDDFFTRVGKL